ncbi:M20/M25/M40 family metallo-hydrolase [Acinetobacter sp. AOR43_HL]|nr:M20/M25/M40 family metallo-hydrolase [Acinetobacter sp. AOR43_HL]
MESTANKLGFSYRRMTSGAGHDAQMIARITPTAMIFVPSKGGVSHNPREFTEPNQLINGANVLLEVVKNLI